MYARIRALLWCKDFPVLLASKSVFDCHMSPTSLFKVRVLFCILPFALNDVCSQETGRGSSWPALTPAFLLPLRSN